MGSLKDKLLSLRTVKPVELDTETTAFVRVMNVEEVLNLRRRIEETGDDMIAAAALIVCACACDEHGLRIFADDQLALVRQVELTVLLALGEAAVELNHLGKKKASPPTNDSSSGSPLT